MLKAAFFDIDGTLIKCQSQHVLTEVMIKENTLTPSQILSIYTWFLLYRLGFVSDSTNLRKKVYQAFTYLSKEGMDHIFQKTGEQITKNALRLSIKDAVEEHQRKQDLVFGISGSISNLCMPICEKFGIREFYATTLNYANGRYTGSWEGVIFEGQIKAHFVRKLSERRSIDLSESFAYADSCSDLPLLEIVGHPVVVCPDWKLRKIAIVKGWTILKD